MNNPRWEYEVDGAIQVGMPPESSIAVAIAPYSGRLSRMWAWNTDSLEIIGSQFLKGRVELMDVSADGKYVAYFVERHSRGQTYIAISRPPYFHALWIKDAFHLWSHEVCFDGESVVYHCYSDRQIEWVQKLDAFVDPPNFQRIESNFGTWPSRLQTLVGNRNFVLDENSEPICYRGVEYYVRGKKLMASGHPVIDFARVPWEDVPTPDWAKVW